MGNFQTIIQNREWEVFNAGLHNRNLIGGELKKIWFVNLKFLSSNSFKGSRIIEYKLPPFRVKHSFIASLKISFAWHYIQNLRYTIKLWSVSVDTILYTFSWTPLCRCELLIRFEDGATDCYDVIIYCTGYLDDFPFLEDSLQMVRRRKLAVELYKQVVHPKCPRLMFIGMSTILYSFSIYWVQGHLCAKLINGKLQKLLAIKS